MKLQDLLAKSPKGLWSNDANVLIDPIGRRYALAAASTPAEEKLAAELIAAALNAAPILLHSLSAQTERVSAALKEAKHCTDRVRQAYNDALTDVTNLVYTQPVVTISSRTALEELVVRIEQLRKSTGD